jgi:hypothetical protein
MLPLPGQASASREYRCRACYPLVTVPTGFEPLQVTEIAYSVVPCWKPMRAVAAGPRITSSAV